MVFEKWDLQKIMALVSYRSMCACNVCFEQTGLLCTALQSRRICQHDNFLGHTRVQFLANFLEELSQSHCSAAVAKGKYNSEQK